METMYIIMTAMSLEALHSLEPGHGKSIISTYLIAHRAKIKDVTIVGTISAVAHMLSIVFLASIAYTTKKFVVPSEVSDIVELLSGVIVTWMGIRILFMQIRPQIIVVGKIGHVHEKTCNHHHHHHHSHETPPSFFNCSRLRFLQALFPVESFSNFTLCYFSRSYSIWFDACCRFFHRKCHYNDFYRDLCYSSSR